MDKRYQVFISSTFTDLKEERKAIIEGLLNAKYIPAGMEMFAASNDEQFKYIKKIIDTCDYYVLIVGARYGSINPSTGKSFTEQEYDYAVEKGIPVLAFLHDAPYDLPSDKRDDDNRDLLEKFRTKVSNGRLCKMWHVPSELIASVIISLGEEVANNPQMGWTRGNVQDVSDVLLQLNDLRIQKEKFEKTISDLRAKIKEYEKIPYDIAQGDDVYEVKGSKSERNYSFNGSGVKYKTVAVKYDISWDDIFSSVGPYLYSYKNYTAFESDLKEGLNSKFKDKVYFGCLEKDCVQTIKIQLNTLGLIDVKASHSNGGGVIEFIGLTEKGKRYLSQLKSIKK